MDVFMNKCLTLAGILLHLTELSGYSQNCGATPPGEGRAAPGPVLTTCLRPAPARSWVSWHNITTPTTPPTPPPPPPTPYIPPCRRGRARTSRTSWWAARWSGGTWSPGPGCRGSRSGWSGTTPASWSASACTACTGGRRRRTRLRRRTPRARRRTSPWSCGRPSCGSRRPRAPGGPPCSRSRPPPRGRFASRTAHSGK